MKNKGFSLVELIVVIAIMAILVGVAVPVYTSYISSAQISADKNLVDEIVHATEIANAMNPFTGTAAIVLSDDGNAVVTGGTDAEKQWLTTVLTDTFGANYAETLKLKHDEWGDGVAVAQVMLNALTTGDVATAMNGIYGSADNLSFTEDIPALMEEIRNVAVEVAGPEATDAGVIGIVNGAAAVTSTWDVETICDLWNSNVSYNGSKYVHSATIPDGTTEFNEKLTIAGVLRAKNTCLALYASKNGYPQYYTALSAYTGNGNLPLDLTDEITSNVGREHLATACGLNLQNSEDYATAEALVALLTQYKSAKDNNNPPQYVYRNDATAYYAMMNVVDTMAKDNTLSGESLDEYFEAVSGPVELFQQLVKGTVTVDSLTASLNGIDAGDNNVTISIVGNGKELMVVVGPSSLLE